MSKEILFDEYGDEIVKFDFDEDDDGETVKQVIVDDEKYIDIEYFAKTKAALENKLAESEERYKKAYQEGLLQKQFDKDMEIDQLKQQLAESEKESNDYVMSAIETNVDLKNRLTQAQKERELDNSFWKQECDSLQKALAEKEKELENYKLCRCVNCTNEYEFMLEGLVEDLERQIDKDNQAKNDFAIEQLEKVKEFCEDYIEFKNEHQENWLYEYIDQQINKLKEGKYENN